MAVKIQFQTKFGVGGEYINFDPQIANKTKINLRMKYWLDKATRDTEGSLPFNDQIEGSRNERITGFNCNYQCDYDLNSVKNVYQQGYDYLKTLPEFAEATDDMSEEQVNQLDAVKDVVLDVKKIII
jgi:hypothetical protein